MVPPLLGRSAEFKLSLVEKLLRVWIGGARRGSWFVVVLFLAGTVAAGIYAGKTLKINTDTTAMLDSALPFQQRAAELKEAFPQIKSDLTIIAKAKTLDEADAFAARLTERLKNKTDTFSNVFATAEETFFLENGLLYLSEGELESRLTQMTKASGLIETLVQSPNADTLFTTLADNDKLADRSELGKETLIDIYAELADVVDASLRNERYPFSWMNALDTSETKDESHLRLVYATPVLDYTRLQPAKVATEKLRDEIALLQADFGGRIEVYVTGDPALRGEELASVTQGIGFSFLISFILVAALLLFAFRSLFLAVLTLTGLIVTIVLTSAFASVAVGELNLVSVAFTVLLVGLGLDFAIHLLLHVQERRVAGQSVREALDGSVHEVGPALALAAPTTALAFLSFVPTKFNGIAQLGVIAGAGVIIAFFVSITFLPAALSTFPKLKSRDPSGVIRAAFRFIERISTPVTVMTVMLGIAALFLLPQARFDADPMSLRNPNSPSVQGFNLLFDDENTIPYRLSRLVSSEREAIETSQQANLLDTVRTTRSLPDFVPKDQDAKLELIDFAAGTLVFALEAEPSADANTDARAGAIILRDRLNEAYTEGAPSRLAALLTEAIDSDSNEILNKIDENIFLFWPQLVDRLRAQLNADYVTLETLPTTLVDRYISQDDRWRVDILPAEDVRDLAALKRFTSSIEEIFPDIGGGAIQTLKAGEAISNAMLQATLIALAVISFVLFVLIRRASLVVLILAPLALAAILTTAAGVVFNVPFNYANVIVLPLLIGIGVDSGIHLVMRQQQVTAGEGLYGTSTPRAVLFSALTTVASFGSLMLSAHRGTASMGQLLSIAIAFTLICTLIVLPAAFRYGEKRTKNN